MNRYGPLLIGAYRSQVLLKRFAEREAVAVDEPEALELHALITSIAEVRQKSPDTSKRALHIVPVSNRH